MRFLFIPGNNSLSHAAKCLVIREKLVARGHECLIAITERNSYFLKNLGCDYVVIPDIQESDGAGFPSISWFTDQQRIIECINAERSLLNRYRPHRVIGVFRFTLKASAHIACIPYDSLICGCMTPYSLGVLGAADDEPKTGIGQNDINMFFMSAGLKFNRSISHLGLEKVNDIRETLIGDRTFLWDFPEFSPIMENKGLIHLGPLSWDRWPYDRLDISPVSNGGPPLAVISFGTCVNNTSIAKRLIRVLVDMGYRIIVAGGGRIEADDMTRAEKDVTICRFAPLQRIFPLASLLISHGGQMTIFEALYNKVPVVVMPFQPEQAHNGICLERIGCGRLLVPSKTFVGSSRIYTDALNCMTDHDIKSAITSLVNDPQTEICLQQISETLGRYNGAETMAGLLEH